MNNNNALLFLIYTNELSHLSGLSVYLNVQIAVRLRRANNYYFFKIGPTNSCM